MAEDWSIDVRKYAPNASSKVIDAIVRYCGIALQNRDSSLVSFTEEEELTRVRENYLKKKLGLTSSDAELNEAIADVGQRMKGDRTKNRVTVYYLLAEHFRKLSIFGGEDIVRSAPKAFAAEEAGVAAAATAGVVGLGDRIVERERPVPPPQPAYAAARATPAPAARSGGIGRWLPWLALAALLLLGWFLLQQRQASRIATAPTVAPAVVPRVAETAPVAVAPTPVVPATPAAPAAINLPIVHFALGSSALNADNRAAIETAAAAIRNDGVRVALTGFTDRTGNLQANEALAQRRAETVRDALVAAGAPAGSIEMRPPAAVENGAMGAPDAEARRVEIARL